MKKAIRFITSPYILIFCCGFLCAVEVYFYQENKYEMQLFESLANDTREEAKAFLGKMPYTGSIFVSATNLTHELVENRMHRFNDLEQQGSFKALLQPVSYDLMTGNGACGSNSYVLARLLMQLGYKVRIAQMGFREGNGRHIITEAWNGKKWVVLDALYAVCFTNPEGELASFSEVAENWSYYKLQVPSNYDPQYDFHSVRYTNWHKIPVILPAIKSVLEFSIGKERTFNICLRKYYIRKYGVLMQLNIFFLILFSFFTVFRIINIGKSRIPLLKG